MFKPGTEWNPKQARLKELLKDKEHFEEARQLCMEMHSFLHSSDATRPALTLMDEVWENLSTEAFTIMPTPKDVTIAWNIWHITRIEDLTVNVLLRDSSQVLSDEWLNKLHISVKDTGNAMTDDEIINLSRTINIMELKNYRDTVGKTTRAYLTTLTADCLNKKFPKERVDRILSEGGLTSHPDSIWLLDFWGRKNTAGILLMPVTRHQVGHLNDCLKLKQKIKSK